MGAAQRNPPFQPKTIREIPPHTRLSPRRVAGRNLFLHRGYPPAPSNTNRSQSPPVVAAGLSTRQTKCRGLPDRCALPAPGSFALHLDPAGKRLRLRHPLEDHQSLFQPFLSQTGRSFRSLERIQNQERRAWNLAAPVLGTSDPRPGRPLPAHRLYPLQPGQARVGPIGR